MRWSLRNQFLVPVLGLIATVLAGTSLLNAWFSQRSARASIDASLQQIAQTLTETRIPLTPVVLQQMRGLSGVEYVVTRNGEVVSSTLAGPDGAMAGSSGLLPATSGTPGLTREYRLAGSDFLHSSFPVRGTVAGQGLQLHLLYPLENWRRAWWRAVLPSLWSGAGGLLLAAVVAILVAQRVTVPLHRLRKQVDAIARRDFLELDAGSGTDELAELGRAVNRMSGMLRDYEQEVRRHEQLRTMGQISAGIAHQLRNSATGCRMAIGIQALRNPTGDTEPLTVALRQLDIMEHYLRSFLDLQRRGSTAGPRPSEVVCLQAVVREVLALMGPMSEHLGTRLTAELPEPPVLVRGSRFDLEQLLVILVRNGLEAAAAPAGRMEPARVTVAVFDHADRVGCVVSDNGPGPADSVRSRLFQPFVSDKPEGTGLGLSVARSIAVEHDGEIAFERVAEQSRFVVSLPAIRGEPGGMPRAAVPTITGAGQSAALEAPNPGEPLQT